MLPECAIKGSQAFKAAVECHIGNAQIWIFKQMLGKANAQGVDVMIETAAHFIRKGSGQVIFTDARFVCELIKGEVFPEMLRDMEQHPVEQVEIFAAVKRFERELLKIRERRTSR